MCMRRRGLGHQIPTVKGGNPSPRVSKMRGCMQDLSSLFGNPIGSRERHYDRNGKCRKSATAVGTNISNRLQRFSTPPLSCATQADHLRLSASAVVRIADGQHVRIKSQRLDDHKGSVFDQNAFLPSARFNSSEKTRVAGARPDAGTSSRRRPLSRKSRMIFRAVAGGIWAEVIKSGV